MPNEDDRFGDVADQLKQTESGDDEEEKSSEEEERQTMSSGSQKPEDAESSPQEPEQSSDDRSTSDPPFSFDATEMHGFYVREGTWDSFVQMRSSVTAACSMFDVSDFEGREFQDACLRVIAQHGEEVAMEILQERGVNADEDRIQEVIELVSEGSGA
jgi:hypothetical protein